VLVFDPADPAPKHFCHVPHAAHVQVMHMAASSSSLHGSSAGAADSSPLLLLKDNRHYSFALLEGASLQGSETAPAEATTAATGAAAVAASQPGPSQQQQQAQAQLADSNTLLGAAAALAGAESESAFEAAFGSLAALRERLAAQRAALASSSGGDALSSLDVDSGAGAVGGQGVKGAAPKWQPLFDVPSHALPPPSELAQALLTMLATAE
jgi:hypothetical protein